MQTLHKMVRANDKDAIEEHTLFGQLEAHLDSGKPSRSFQCDDKGRAAIKALQLLTDKPVMYVANTNEEGVQNGNRFVDAVRARAAEEGAVVIPICAKIEAEISQLEASDRELFLADLGMEEAGLDRAIRQAYQLLGLITYFTAGKKECRAWTVRKGSTAPQAAGVIHTDFEKGFIRAEVMSYGDWDRLGSEQSVKDAGLYRVEGKEYIVKDGDIMYFRFNV